ncbi:MAG: patatin-like phospholipase family protein [Solirubrobacterales bacterium]
MNDQPSAPDLLVLGSGGVLGDVWMTGLVVGLERSGLVDPKASGQFCGTSAGSIVATRLAAAEDLEALIDRYVDLGGPAATEPPGPLDEQPGNHRMGRLLAAHGAFGQLLRRTILTLVPNGRKHLKYLDRDMKRLAPEWPDRLNVVSFNQRTGRRTVFNRGQSHGLTVSEAVQASCAIPGVFTPIKDEIGVYVDGGVWSPVNLDAVPVEPGQTVICLTPSGSDQGATGLRSKLTGGLYRSIVKGEVARLRARGIRVLNVVPDPAASRAIGPSRMASGREAEVYAAGIAQGIELAEPLAEWLAPVARPEPAVTT